MATEKKPADEVETRRHRGHHFDFLYPRIMTVLLALNLFLQILILILRWYRL